MTKPQNENPYLLLTPGPLSTSPSVKAVMLRDWCTWDDDYNQGVVQVIRRRLVELATRAEGYTSVLMQGSGTFVVEALLGTAVARTQLPGGTNVIKLKLPVVAGGGERGPRCNPG